MNHPVKQMISEIIGAHRDGIDAGYDLQQRKIDTIVAAYTRALEDPAAKVPTYLHAAIEASKSGQMTEEAPVSKRVGVSATEYSIKGSWASVVAALHSIFVNYHPHGYGTHVHWLGMDNDGQYSARVSRANSCD
jgi:hypothetical protein